MEDKLRKIFKFLKKNRCYNRELQTKCYIADISPYDSDKNSKRIEEIEEKAKDFIKKLKSK